MPQTAVRPRDAASLILVRGQGSRSEILMGRRAKRHRFLPDLYVFPGGRVDAADHRVALDSDLRPEVAERLRICCSAGRARALAVAAVRETHEETGLLIGSTRGGMLRPALAPLDHLVRAITPPASPIRFHARFFVADAAHASGELRSNGELLDLAWRRLEDCLRLPLADITEFLLGELPAYLETRRIPGRVPLFSYRHGRAHVQRDR